MNLSFMITETDFGDSGIDMTFVRQKLNIEELNEICKQCSIKKIEKKLKNMINGVRYKEKKEFSLLINVVCV